MARHEEAHQGGYRWRPIPKRQANPAICSAPPCRAAASSHYVSHLRPAMKWSDAHPFTADDVVFVFEDLLTNTELYKSVTSIFVINGQTCKVTKVSDTAVKFSFAGPYGLLLEQLATPLGQHP